MKRRQEAAEAAERERLEREAAEAAAAAAAQDAVDRAASPEPQPQGEWPTGLILFFFQYFILYLKLNLI